VPADRRGTRPDPRFRGPDHGPRAARTSGHRAGRAAQLPDPDHRRVADAHSMKRALQRLTDHHLYELWGLTEGVATIIAPRDMRARPHSVGRPMLGCDIRLIDDQDRDVTGSGTGEIVGRSAAMMSGYWNRPDANAAILWHDA